MTASFHRTFGILATAIVLLAIIWGFVIIGSPGTERQRKFDEQRINDLRTINSEILNIVRDWRGYDPNAEIALRNPLPATLGEVEKLARYARPNITDPETGTPYEYRVKNQSEYELCAMFTFRRELQYDIFWDHPAGRHCYQFDAKEAEGFANLHNSRIFPATPKPL
jgi:hypothetical protein